MTRLLSIGFTGTREGMTPAQLEAVRQLLEAAAGRPGLVRHGDCVGADEQFDALARAVAPGLEVHIHPPDKHALAFGCWVRGVSVVHDPAPFLQRNRQIVNAARVLIAASQSPREVLKSGTWMTIRYARVRGVERRIVWPDGRVDPDRGSA